MIEFHPKFATILFGNIAAYIAVVSLSDFATVMSVISQIAITGASILATVIQITATTKKLLRTFKIKKNGKRGLLKTVSRKAEK